MERDKVDDDNGTREAKVSSAAIPTYQMSHDQVPLPELTVEQLENLAASATCFSPELLRLIQRERMIRSFRLYNALAEELQTANHFQRSMPSVDTSMAAGGMPPMSMALRQLRDFSIHPLSSSVQSGVGLNCMSNPRSLREEIIPQAWNNHRHTSLSPAQHSKPPIVHYHTLHQRLGPTLFEANRAPVAAHLPETPRIERMPREQESASITKGQQVTSRLKALEGSTTKKKRAPDPAKSTLSAQPIRCQKLGALESSHEFEFSSQSAVELKFLKRRRYQTETFPKKLLRMVQTAKKQGYQHLISFTDDGTAIRMSAPKTLTEQVFPKFFVS